MHECNNSVSRQCFAHVDMHLCSGNVPFRYVVCSGCHAGEDLEQRPKNGTSSQSRLFLLLYS